MNPLKTRITTFKPFSYLVVNENRKAIWTLLVIMSKTRRHQKKNFSSIQSTISEETAKTCDDVWQIFSSLVQDEKDTWCVENAGEIDSMSAFKGTKNKSINPYYFLRSHKRKLRKRPKRRGYCRCVYRKRCKEMYLLPTHRCR